MNLSINLQEIGARQILYAVPFVGASVFFNEMPIKGASQKEVDAFFKRSTIYTISNLALTYFSIISMYYRNMTFPSMLMCIYGLVNIGFGAKQALDHYCPWETSTLRREGETG